MAYKQLCKRHFRDKKAFKRLYFGKTSDNDLVFMRNDFLRLVGAPNVSLILIIIDYMFKYSVGIKTNFARVTWEPKKYFQGYTSEKLVIRT